MGKFKVNYKIWLEKEGKVFGQGPKEILELIEETGSLHQAAQKMNMSYSQAWNLIKTLEERLGFKLISTQAGGKGGGGSSLTKESQELLKKYASFMEEAEKSLKELENKFF
ncbi:MAG: winged helix-turn-helix domain-containing protein [Bacillota bacterium]